MFVSFDDGNEWQPLQRNLPPVSVRDIAVHDTDLIVATHGRGFWVMDDISPLRQFAPDVTSGDAYLFHPADVIKTPEPNENGTPLPRDEPFADNPTYGAAIDYYLQRASDPVTLEIVDAQGQSIRRWSSRDPVTSIDPDTLQIPAFWIHPQEPPSAAAGMHRWYWDLRHAVNPAATRRGGGGRQQRGEEAAPGSYTVKLTANGRTYTQPLIVKPDPRARGGAQ